MKTITKKLFAAAAVTAALFTVKPAQAGDVDFHFAYIPNVLYAKPAPVYYRPAPRVVYYTPSPWGYHYSYAPVVYKNNSHWKHDNRRHDNRRGDRHDHKKGRDHHR